MYKCRVQNCNDYFSSRQSESRHVTRKHGNVKKKGIGKTKKVFRVKNPVAVAIVTGDPDPAPPAPPVSPVVSPVVAPVVAPVTEEHLARLTKVMLQHKPLFDQFTGPILMCDHVLIDSHIPIFDRFSNFLNRKRAGGRLTSEEWKPISETLGNLQQYNSEDLRKLEIWYQSLLAAGNSIFNK